MPYLAPVLRVSTKILLVLVLRIQHWHGSLELLGPKSGTTNVTEVMGGAAPPATEISAAIPSTKMMSENINEKYIQQWSTDEINTLIAIWSSTEMQDKIEKAVRKAKIYEEIRGELEIAGFKRTTDQITNKLKIIKKAFIHQNVLVCLPSIH